MTVRDLLSRIDSRELTEWAAFIKIENDPPEKEAFYSNDPKVMADKMRGILGPGKTKKGKRRK